MSDPDYTATLGALNAALEKAETELRRFGLPDEAQVPLSGPGITGRLGLGRVGEEVRLLWLPDHDPPIPLRHNAPPYIRVAAARALPALADRLATIAQSRTTEISDAVAGLERWLETAGANNPPPAEEDIEACPVSVDGVVTLPIHVLKRLDVHPRQHVYLVLDPRGGYRMLGPDGFAEWLAKAR